MTKIEFWGGPKDGESMDWEQVEMVIPMMPPDEFARMIHPAARATPQAEKIKVQWYQRREIMTVLGREKVIMLYMGERSL